MSAGAIIWQDLFTPNPRVSLDFYSSLFGWTADLSDDPDYGPVRMLYANGTAIAGIEATGTDSPTLPHWLPYIKVPDTVDAACARAVSSGATVVQPAREYAAFGRYAVLTDPDGACFAVYQSVPDSGPARSKPDWPPQTGTVSWYAVAGFDSAKTAAFYATVFGYDATTSDMDDLGDNSLVLKTGDEMHAGVLGHGGSMPSQWLLYFVVEDIATARDRAAYLGGQVLTPIVTIPEIGQTAGLIDPTGATFFLHQPE